jgi:hypothetical protein
MLNYSSNSGYSNINNTPDSVISVASVVTSNRESVESTAVAQASADASADLGALDVSVDSQASVSPEERSHRRTAKSFATNNHVAQRQVVLDFDSGDTLPDPALEQYEDVSVVSFDAHAAEALSLPPELSGSLSISGSNGPAVPKSMGVAESLRRLQHAWPLSAPLRYFVLFL